MRKARNWSRRTTLISTPSLSMAVKSYSGLGLDQPLEVEYFLSQNLSANNFGTKNTQTSKSNGNSTRNLKTSDKKEKNELYTDYTNFGTKNPLTKKGWWIPRLRYSGSFSIAANKAIGDEKKSEKKACNYLKLCYTKSSEWEKYDDLSNNQYEC